MSKIYLLHGQEAIRTYFDEEIEEVKKVEFSTSIIEHDEQSDVADIVRETMSACDGWMASCIITEEEYNFLNLEQEEEKSTTEQVTKNYNVHWSIEVSADSPREAAEEALHSISHGTAKVFRVIEEGDLEGVEIDLCHTEDFDNNT